MSKQRKHPLHSHGRKEEQFNLLQRVFGNIQVVDAKASLIVTVEPIDSVGAVRTNAADCVFSKACHRLFHSSKAVFFRSIVYVDIPDEDGMQRIMRFVAGTRMAAAIREYDKTGTFAPGTYHLGAPPVSKKLDVQLRRGREFAKRRTKEKRRELHKKARERQNAMKLRGRAPKTIALAAEARGFVRNGTGLIQTIIDVNNNH